MTTRPRLQELLRRTHRIQTATKTNLMIRVGIPHDRYTVAFHADTCQMWVLDTTDYDQPRGPYLSSRQAWQIANELNLSATRTAGDQ